MLGEGMRWDGRAGETLRVDITEGLLIREVPGPDGDLAEAGVLRVDAPLAAVAPVEGGGGWITAAGRGFARLRPTGELDWIAVVAPEGARMNDGACDPAGRFWAGTISPPGEARGAALHRLDGDGTVTTMLDGLAMSNGIGWSPDGTAMYLVDSGPRTITAYPFEAATGMLGEGRVVVTIPEADGTPDGMAVDAEGALWVALFDGAEVRRYAPRGTLLARVPIPAPQVTCCAFGPPDGTTLYVTTATEHWSAERRRADPASGHVFRVPGAGRGVPAAAFREAA